jgi:hypothetical protein
MQLLQRKRRAAVPRQGPAVIGDGVEVQRSTLNGAGLGLFTVRPFERGALITQYDGRVIARAEALDLRAQGRDSHVRTLETGHTAIDGLREPLLGRGGGSFANQAPPPLTPNARYWTSAELQPRVWLRATRRIEPGEEVWVAYGARYTTLHLQHAGDARPPQRQASRPFAAGCGRGTMQASRRAQEQTGHGL